MLGGSRNEERKDSSPGPGDGAREPGLVDEGEWCRLGPAEGE